MDWREEYKQKLTTPKEAVRIVKSNDRVYEGTASSVAYGLLEALWERRHELENVTLMGSNGYQYTPCYYEKDDNPFEFCTYFMGVNERSAIKMGKHVSFTSVHLSLADIWSEFTARPDVSFFEVSKPDENGYMSYGPSGVAVCDKLKQVSKYIILEVNENTPYVMGENNLIHVSEADAICEVKTEYANYVTQSPDEISKTIASYILDEIHDGDTFQLGLGNISTAIGYGLKDRNDLGIYTELLNQPMLELIKSGNVTNKYKGYYDGKTVFAFSTGAPELYRALDHNPKFWALPFSKANDARNVALNKNMISINATMALNIYGEAAADCIAWKQQSGTGGQTDFVKGAQWSEGGKSFIVTQSYFEKNGKKYSKILPYFAPGTAVTTTRADINYIATEYGCVNLKPLTMEERASAIIELAHPDFRPELRAEARKAGLLR